MQRILVIIALLLAAPATSPAATDIPPLEGKHFLSTSPSLKISATQADALEERLASMEKDFGGTQMAVLVIDSLGGKALEDFSLKVAETWKLGRKRGKGQDGDNGLLLVIAVQDRKYRFEVGYGLEGRLPDSLVGTIGRDSIVPAFREGKYLDGIYLAIDAVKRVLNKGRQLPQKALEVPQLGDKRLHIQSSMLRLAPHEIESLELSLDRFEWGLDNMRDLRMAIIAVDSLEGEPIDSFAARASEAWKLGQKKGEGVNGDNGLLLVLAMKDRKFRFEVGEDLQDFLSEQTAEAIGRDIMIQDFWAADYERGLRYTIDAVNALATGHNPQDVLPMSGHDERGAWERVLDVVQYRKFSRPTMYDYLHPGLKKADPAWGQVDYRKARHQRWVLIIMVVAAGACSIYSFLLGGAVGMIEGAAYSWFLMGSALPHVLLFAAIGLVLGMVAKYLAAGALAAGLVVGVGGKFGGGGAGGSW